MEQYSGATTTANSESEQRLKVDVSQKKKIIRKHLKRNSK